MTDAAVFVIDEKEKVTPILGRFTTSVVCGGSRSNAPFVERSPCSRVLELRDCVRYGEVLFGVVFGHQTGVKPRRIAPFYDAYGLQLMLIAGRAYAISPRVRQRLIYSELRLARFAAYQYPEHCTIAHTPAQAAFRVYQGRHPHALGG